MPRFAAIACAALVATLVGGTASAQSAGSLVDESAALNGQLAQVRSEYLRPAELRRTFDLASRLVDGRVRYYLQDYSSAAIILVQVVENDAYRGMAGYDEARWLLADSFYHERNFTLARGYFEDILRDRDPRYGLDASRRLLEIAFAQNRYDGLDDLYAELQRQQGGRATPELAYVHGKALYFQGRYDEALREFGSIGASDELYSRARYLLGVCRVRLGEMDSGLVEFQSLADMLDADDRDAEEQELYELTQLALGRVHYEQGRWDDAVFAYATVPRSSDHFDAALYETAWTQIREERFQPAINNLEILTIVARDGRFVPEARLLVGDLRMRMGQYDRAVAAFDAVDAEYGPVERELIEVSRSHDDADGFFDALVDPDSGAFVLPPLAEPWFDADMTVDRALALVRDLSAMQEDIEQGMRIVQELEAALQGSGGVDIFPVWREGWMRATEMENAALSLRTRAVESERDLLWPSLGSAERQQYDSLRDAREALEARYRQSPRSAEEIDARARRVVSQLEDASMQVFLGEQELLGMEQEIEAARAILADRVRAGEISQEQARRMRAELQNLQDDIDAQRAASQSLRDEIAVSQREVGVADRVNASERELRAMLVNALRAEAAFLGARQSGASEHSDAFRHYDTVEENVDRFDAAAATFYSDMLGMVDSQTLEFRNAVQEERAALERYQQVLRTYRDQSRELVGEVAHQAFLHVQERFSEITLRANLGIIDVAWRKKEELTDRIDDLFAERNRQLRVLDADFAEILNNE